MKRILKIALLFIGLLAVGAAALTLSVVLGKAPIPDGMRLPGVEVVKDGYVSACILDLASGGVVLVDSGNDPEAKSIRTALARRNLGSDAVRAILLTHGDLDHVRGARAFPKAAVMALGPDIGLVEGRSVRGPLPARSTGVKVGRTLAGGDVIEVEDLRIEVFPMPGHTAGSAALLSRGVLFLGDSAEISSRQSLEAANWFFCDDRALNRQSLRALATALQPRADDITAIACSHSGVLTRGLAPLAELADALARP